MERQTNLLHLMEQKKWYGDGGYVMSHCCMQRVSQTNYDWIPGTYAGWFHAVIRNKMKHNLDFSEVWMMSDEDFPWEMIEKN